MKNKVNALKIIFSVIACAMIAVTAFSTKRSRSISYAATEKCPHEYSDDCDEECNLCGEKRTPKHRYGAWTVVKEATNDEEGLKERECALCHAKQQNVLQKTAVPEKQKTKTLSQSDIAGIVAGSVLCAGAVAFIMTMLIRKSHRK